MDENKKMISLHEQEFSDSDAFQVYTSTRLKNVEAQVGHLVEAFKEKFSRTSLPNPNECMDTSFSSMQKFPILKFVEEGENELEIEKKVLLNNLENEEPLVDKQKNLCHDREIFVTTDKSLSLQINLCRDREIFVMRENSLLQQKNFVATKFVFGLSLALSPYNKLCRDKVCLLALSRHNLGLSRQSFWLCCDII